MVWPLVFIFSKFHFGVSFGYSLVMTISSLNLHFSLGYPLALSFLVAIGIAVLSVHLYLSFLPFTLRYWFVCPPIFIISSLNLYFHFVYPLVFLFFCSAIYLQGKIPK